MTEILKERWMKLAGVINEAQDDEVDFDVKARMEEPDVPMEVVDKLVKAKLEALVPKIREMMDQTFVWNDEAADGVYVLWDFLSKEFNLDTKLS